MVFAPFLTTLTLTLLTLPPSTLPHPLSTSRYPLLPHPSDLTCIDSPDWVTPNFLAGDCYTAIDKFRNRDLDAHQGMTLEFLANGYQPFFRTPFMQVTPRRYSYKSCTMVVALLRDLEAGEVVPVSLWILVADIS